MINGPERWYTVGAHLVQAVRDALTTPVTRAGQVPGDIAWDDTGCGLLAVTVPRVYLSELFPEETEGPVGARCEAPYEVGEFTVSVLRCAPQPQGQKLAPEVTALDKAARLLLRDLSETMTAVTARMCQLKDADDVSDYFITPGESVGPEGAAVGFTLRVLVSLERF